MKKSFLAAAGGIAFSSILMVSPAFAQSSRVDANAMPTTDSTPSEKAETAAINNQVSAANAAADAQADANNQKYQEQQQAYQSQQRQYRNQLERNKDQQEQYRDRTAAYESLRARFAAERAAYHRGVWPERYSRWVIVERDPNLIGERVELITGSRVGTVIDTAHMPNGNVSALLVRLDNDKIVWIDSADVRYNRADGIVMTNLDQADLHHMADQRL